MKCSKHLRYQIACVLGKFEKRSRYESNYSSFKDWMFRMPCVWPDLNDFIEINPIVTSDGMDFFETGTFVGPR